MTIDADDKILQDFLVEAGEILEKLGEQLVELEQRPDDYDLLNAVFRGFHTIKGGAGFLSIAPLVQVCHRAEDVFNLLRQGTRKVDAGLMDVILRVLDVVNDMFQSMRAARDPHPADTLLLEQLEVLALGQALPGASVAPTPAPAPSQTAPASDDITDQEFEDLLDSMGQGGAAPAANGASPKAGASAQAPASDEITDDEFEALLDVLNAPGGGEKKVDLPAVKSVVGEIVNEAPKGLARTEPAAPAAPAAETTVRVDTKRLDDIMNMVGELVLVRNRLVTLEAAYNDEAMSKAVSNMDVVTANLQLAVMKTRMQPIKKVFGRFPRVVRDLARSLQKEVTLEMQGEETDLDKNLVEALADPLVHLVRNAVDHGIERPDVREANGKSRMGTVMLTAEQEGDHIRLTIADDGAGMDPEVLRRKVVEKGLLDVEAAKRLSREDCFNLIFLPGFSTKTEISDVSGRGVGMDVVKTSIVALNGTVEIDSEPGKGSRISIKVPLTLAIMPTLMVVVGGQTFALPLSCVAEILHLDLTKTNTVDNQLVVMVRERPLPLFYLRRWLMRAESESTWPADGHVVVVHLGTQRVGFIVDQLIGQEEVVIKPLGALLHGTSGLAGATITGDGRMALILDVPSLILRYTGNGIPGIREVA
jgi:two-component system chemotaxis sensor kinase CheA